MSIAAVTCHFNPARYKQRVANYYKFAEPIKKRCPLLTVELAFDHYDYEIDNDYSLRLRGGAKVWQKERLLNLGIERLLADGFDKIIWLDADVIFDKPDWLELIDEALDDYQVVQCFNGTHIGFDDQNILTLGVIEQAHNHQHYGGERGKAWAARAETLQELPLWDLCLTGGGDSAFAYACVNALLGDNFSSAVEQGWLENAEPDIYDKYLTYIDKLQAVVGKSIGYVKQPLVALPHGSYEKRDYYCRHRNMHWLTLDHIEIGDNGAWQWTEQADYFTVDRLERYFYSRQEDGPRSRESTTQRLDTVDGKTHKQLSTQEPG